MEDLPRVLSEFKASLDNLGRSSLKIHNDYDNGGGGGGEDDDSCGYSSVVEHFLGMHKALGLNLMPLNELIVFNLKSQERI